MNDNKSLDNLFRELLKNGKNVTFGEAIRKVRQARNWKQTDLSDLAGISNSYLCDIEKNRVTPSLKTMQRLGRILVEGMGNYKWQFFLYFNYGENENEDRGTADNENI